MERVGGEEDSGDAVVAARGSDGSDDMLGAVKARRPVLRSSYGMWRSVVRSIHERARMLGEATTTLTVAAGALAQAAGSGDGTASGSSQASDVG